MLRYAQEGQLGTGDSNDQPVPKLVSSMTLIKVMNGERAVHVMCGHSHTVVVMSTLVRRACAFRARRP
jgi:hypothetical protein